MCIKVFEKGWMEDVGFKLVFKKRGEDLDGREEEYIYWVRYRVGNK